MPRNILPTPPEVTHKGATIRKYTGRLFCWMCGQEPRRKAEYECTVKTAAGPATLKLCDWHAERWRAETKAKEISDG